MQVLALKTVKFVHLPTNLFIDSKLKMLVNITTWVLYEYFFIVCQRVPYLNYYLSTTLLSHLELESQIWGPGSTTSYQNELISFAFYKTSTDPCGTSRVIGSAFDFAVCIAGVIFIYGLSLPVFF